MWLAEVYVPESKIKAILIPTMIVQGDRDGIRIEHATELYRNIDQSQLCILPQISHFVFDERPEWISTLAIDFFSLK